MALYPAAKRSALDTVSYYCCKKKLASGILIVPSKIVLKS